MASPNFDQLSLRFSRAIEDPVAAAASDGDVTSAVRSDYLNRATNEFMQEVYRLLGKERSRKVLQAMIDTQAVTIVNTGVAVESTYQNLPLELVKTGSTQKYILWHSKSDLDNYRNPHVDYAYVIDAGSIFVYEIGSVLNSGTATFTHLGYRTNITAGDATGDTALPTQFWDVVVELAVSLYYFDINQPDKAIRDRYNSMLTLLAKDVE